MWKKLLLIGITVILPPFATAQDKAFTLDAPAALVDTGFLKHLLPRFSLKKGIRITLTDGAGGEAAFGTQGTPVFRQGDTVWHFAAPEGADTDAFLDWLTSDVGRRTIEAFAPEGTPMFSADTGTVETVQQAVLTGDAVLGEKVSLSQCGRCHVVNDTNKMNAIGSTPSFALMRNFADWQERFETFYVLKPHAAFTQVAEVTAPFPDNLPSPIAPIEVTLDEIDAITAYVSTITPADLGAPIQAGQAFQ
ncbi:MAG: hypothetical protein AB8B82_04680 [Roseovarius sp.]